MVKKEDRKRDLNQLEAKMPPYSMEAEQAVLGALMLDSESWDKVSNILSEHDFYHKKHRLIFKSIAKLGSLGQPFDVLTLTEELKSIDNLEEVGGELYLFELTTKNTPTVANIVAYAEIVKGRSILRQLITISSTIAEEAYKPEGKDYKEVLDNAENRIFKIAEEKLRSQGPVEINSLLTKAAERIDVLYHSDTAITGVPTGFSDLDEMTSGWQDGELIIVAGRPSMGKTTLAMNMVERAAIKDRKTVLVFSMEMPGESLAMRMISSLGHIEQHRVRTGKLQDEDWPRLTSAISMFSDTGLFIDDTSALSPADIRFRARRVARTAKQGLGLIVIDYLQLMQIPGFKDGRVAEITEISRSLKALAKELKVPVIALSQLNRGLEQRVDKRPQMADLRESGAIEQDADVILFIYRDEVYHEDSQDKGIAEIIIAKQRNGPIGKVRLTFLGQYTRFENFAPVY